ncbi:hypothetical protein [Nocardioides pakistanensis]
MSWPKLAFVAAPDEGAAVRLDINESGFSTGGIHAAHDGFSLGAPSLSGAPGARGRAWGTRTLNLPLRVQGPKHEAVALQQLLAREIVRDGWLRWQLAWETDPVWFRYYASAPDAVSLERVMNGTSSDTWLVTARLAADPFAVGALVEVGPLALGNLPDSEVLPTVAGDVPAPALVTVSTPAGGMLGPAVAVTGEAPVVASAPAWGPAVGTAVTDSWYLAGSYRPTTGALDSWTTAATWTPAGARGRTRGWVRLGGSSDTGGLWVRWAAAGVTSDPVFVPVAAMRRWVDAGEIPAGDGPVALQVKRAAAGGETHFDDRLMLIPAEHDDDILALDVADAGTGQVAVTVDADDRVATLTGTATTRPGARGGWPQLHPDRDNHLTVGQNLDPALTIAGRDDDPIATATVTVSYRPRYLWGL